MTESFLTIGIVLGLSAGIAPGPLMTLVISETLQHDVKAGIRVALAPVVTDLPIIALTLFVLSKLSDFHAILGTISIAGSLYILFMAYECIQANHCDIDYQKAAPKSLRKGIVTNFLSPHPYLFWFSVGTPLIFKAWDLSIVAAIAFVGVFYLCLVGAKIGAAVLVGKSKSFIRGSTYRNTMRLLGLMLAILALTLFWDGLELLGIVTAPDSL